MSHDRLTVSEVAALTRRQRRAVQAQGKAQ